MLPQDVTTFYITQGVLGVTVIVEAIVIIILYRALQTLQIDRLNDYKETTNRVVTVLQENTQSNTVLAAKIETGKRSS